MYKKHIPPKTTITWNNSLEGEFIEMKIRRIMNNKEPITDGAELIYTDRKDGVLPDYDIRTDRWEHAIDAMDRVQKAQIAKRKAAQEKKSLGEQAKEGMEKENQNLPKGQGESGAQSIPETSNYTQNIL